MQMIQKHYLHQEAMLVDQQALLQYRKFDLNFISLVFQTCLSIKFEYLLPLLPFWVFPSFKLTHLQESMWVNQTIPQIDSGTNMFEYYY